MQFELVERYIYAVVKRLPQKQRADVEKELRSLISDMLEQRCGDMPPTEHDVRVVLTELGTPSELADKYDQDTHTALIGPPYYAKYKLVMKIVFFAAGGGMLLAGFLGLLTSTPAHPFLSVFQLIGSVFMAEVWAFAFVTGIFAFFERKGVKFDADESFNDLPPVPSRKETFKPAEPIIGIVFSIVILASFLLAGPRFIGWYGPDGFVPMLDVGTVARLWPLLAVACALGVAKESVRAIEGRHTWRLAWVTLGVGLLSTALVGAFTLAQGLVSPAFISEIMTRLIGEGNSFMRTVFADAPRYFFGLFCFATLLDIVTEFAKAARDRTA